MTDSAHTPSVKPGPRKGHRKSRTGCRTCKTRKIKCDERHPSCINCLSHGVRCPYQGPESRSTELDSTLDKIPYPAPNSSTHEDNTKPTLAPSSKNIHGKSDISTLVNNIVPNIELELLHHFTFTTYTTFAHSPAVHEFYRTTLVHLGLKCEYLMQALLSVSAQHLAFCTPDLSKRDFYIAQGIELQRRSSKGAVQYMNRTDLDVEELINLFLFSVLTVNFALASHPHHNSTVPASDTSVFPEWTFLINGTKSLASLLGHRAGDHPVLATYREHGKKWIMARQRLLADYFPDRLDGASTGVFCKVDVNAIRSPFTNNSGSGVGNKFCSTSLEASSLRQLRRRVVDSVNLKAVQTTKTPDCNSSGSRYTTFTPPASDRDSASPSSLSTTASESGAHQRLLQIYTHALDELELIFAYTATHPRPLDPQDTILFLWEVSDSLIPLLQQQPTPPPEAVAIFAHYAIILKMYEEEGPVWWVRGWARQIIKQAHDVLDDIHRPWIVWPMREVGLDFDFAGGGLANTMFISLV